MSEDVILDRYQTDLKHLEEDYRTESDKLRFEQDGSTQNKIKRKLEALEQQINECERTIKDHLANDQRQKLRAALDSLSGILKAHDKQFDAIAQAYQKTIRNWPVKVRPNVQTVDEILAELARIPPNQTHSAREEFVAHLIHQTSDPVLAEALTQWGAEYYPDRDWPQFQAQIEAAQAQRLEQAQPAILITIARSDEASTQAQDGEPYYQFNAWLIADIKTYQQQKTGYQRLIAIDSPQAQPCRLEDLILKTPGLLQALIAKHNALCPGCHNYPQIHVFLPLELMHLGVDIWSLNPNPGRRAEYLGHDYLVFLRCSNRYDSNYKNRPSWLKLWQRHQAIAPEPAHQAFVPGHDQDLDGLMDTLEAAVQPDRAHGKVVGLHVTQAPINIEELCYELLESGLPLAIWSRRDLADSAHESQLTCLLESGCLETLPHRVKTKRRETRSQNSPDKHPDRHIGHHLSLLWDDPHLVPPKSA
jgi:vWA-MoxR associated protein C-terminal domain/vWA-MoxR associated protein middle region (VMAP-M) 1/Effector-associated domain 9